MTLAMRAARLCPDCDILTESPICSLCGRNHTVPLTAWVRPLDAVSPPQSLPEANRLRAGHDLWETSLRGRRAPGGSTAPWPVQDGCRRGAAGEQTQRQPSPLREPSSDRTAERPPAGGTVRRPEMTH